MNFACVSEKEFSTKKRLETKKTISEATRKRKDFIENHHFSISISPSGKCTLEISKRQQKHEYSKDQAGVETRDIAF